MGVKYFKPGISRQLQYFCHELPFEIIVKTQNWIFLSSVIFLPDRPDVIFTLQRTEMNTIIDKHMDQHIIVVNPVFYSILWQECFVTRLLVCICFV